MRHSIGARATASRVVMTARSFGRTTPTQYFGVYRSIPLNLLPCRSKFLSMTGSFMRMAKSVGSATRGMKLKNPGLRTLRPHIDMAELRTATPPAKKADGFYLSAEWLAIRDRVRFEAGGRCQAPGCDRAERRMFVDHVVELKDGGAPLARSNLWLLCGSCHSSKTAAERSRRTAERVGGGSKNIERGRV